MTYNPMMWEAIHYRENRKVSDVKKPFTIQVSVTLTPDQLRYYAPGIENFERAKKAARKNMLNLIRSPFELKQCSSDEAELLLELG